MKKDDHQIDVEDSNLPPYFIIEIWKAIITQNEYIAYKYRNKEFQIIIFVIEGVVLNVGML